MSTIDKTLFLLLILTTGVLLGFSVAKHKYTNEAVEARQLHMERYESVLKQRDMLRLEIKMLLDKNKRICEALPLL